MPASLLLPMGRYGPAFLAYANFQVYLKWNQSLNYSVTAAYLATRLAGAPRHEPGRRPDPRLELWSRSRICSSSWRGAVSKSGEIDGKLGAATRSQRQGGPDQAGPARRFLSDSRSLLAAAARASDRQR